MWTLILTTSLLSKFNHNLDVKIIPNILTEKSCREIGEKAATDLRAYDKDISTTISCVYSSK